MSAIKNYYHDEICAGMNAELQKANDLDAEYQAIREEDAQIIARGEELKHTELPNFLF